MYRNNLDAALERIDALERENIRLLRCVEEWKVLANKKSARIAYLESIKREDGQAPVIVGPYNAISRAPGPTNAGIRPPWAFDIGSNASNRGGW